MACGRLARPRPVALAGLTALAAACGNSASGTASGPGGDAGAMVDAGGAEAGNSSSGTADSSGSSGSSGSSSGGGHEGGSGGDSSGGSTGSSSGSSSGCSDAGACSVFCDQTQMAAHTCDGETGIYQWEVAGAQAACIMRGGTVVPSCPPGQAGCCAVSMTGGLQCVYCPVDVATSESTCQAIGGAWSPGTGSCVPDAGGD